MLSFSVKESKIHVIASQGKDNEAMFSFRSRRNQFITNHLKIYEFSIRSKGILQQTCLKGFYTFGHEMNPYSR